ncbi:MAG: YciI family protein [Fimbriimonadaceae bacterium]|nr:YciI family protein [Fimbriimonadaceae bacterium]
MTQYALIFFETETEMARRESETAPQYWSAWSAYIDLLADENVLVRGSGAGLQPPSTATTVRVSGDQLQIQDGPIPGLKEQLGGVVVIAVESLDEALRWAAKAPCAAAGTVEVRPVLPPPPTAA